MTKNQTSCTDCSNDNCLIKNFWTSANKHNSGAHALDELQLKNEKLEYKYGKKQSIFQEGNPSSGIYFILSGTVKVFKRGPLNKNQIVRFSTAGDILGHRGLISSGLYPVSAQAITQVTVCYFSKEFFFSKLRSIPDFSISLLLNFCDELNQEESKLRDMAVFTVREKVAKSLLIFIEKFGLNANHEIANSEIFSRQDLAEYVGLTPNQVTKVLAEFKKDGIIETVGKKIKVLNRKSIEGIVNY